MAFQGNNIFRNAQTGAASLPQGGVAQRLAAMSVPSGFQRPMTISDILAMQSMGGQSMGGQGVNAVPNSVLGRLPVGAAPPPPAPQPMQKSNRDILSEFLAGLPQGGI
ncbi:MAG: hypothetical protein QNJ62_05200 [Methyloceanibacter sp.]|nr:hypothetical protein [Methyloceanibacter sp.]